MKKIKSDIDWFGFAELLRIGLEELPKNERALYRLIKKENWRRRPRVARGGGYEYHISSLPLKARVDFLNRISSLSEDKKENRSLENKAKRKSSSTSLKVHKASEKVAIELSKSKHFGSDISKKNLEKARVREEILKRIQILSCNGFEKEVMRAYIESYNKVY